MRPSFLGLAFGGILIGVAAVLLLIGKTNTRLIAIILLLSIAISVHSILHFYEEIVYGFNPLKGGSFIAKDKPIIKIKKIKYDSDSDSDSDDD